jgi:tetratricopeptide (TPR) repeat protein
VYFKAGRLDDALARYKDALEIKPNWYTPQMGMAWVHGLKEDYGEALRSLDQYLEGDHSHKWQGHFAKSFFLSWLGRWREVDDELQKMKDVMEGPEGGGNKWLPMLYLILRANVDLEKGDLGKARKDVQDWRDYREKTWPDRADPDYIFMTGWLEFKEGRIAEAKAVLDKYTSYLTESKTERIRQSRFWSALLDSEILLAEGSPERAIEIFRQAPSIGRMENSENTVGSAVAYNFPYLKDVAARAYIKMGEVGKAIAEYERLTAFDPKQPERRLIHPLYYYRLAKLYEQKGNRGKARARYERFLELWKDAEPGQPEVDDARARLAALI